jgi:hypothetical protein
LTAFDTNENESTFSEEVSVVFDFEVPPAVTDLSGEYLKADRIVALSWTYPSEWNSKLNKWMFYYSTRAGGPYEVLTEVDVAGSDGNFAATIPSPVDTQQTLYFVIVAHRGQENNLVFSANSNEVSLLVGEDTTPPRTPMSIRIQFE